MTRIYWIVFVFLLGLFIYVGEAWSFAGFFGIGIPLFILIYSIYQISIQESFFGRKDQDNKNITFIVNINSDKDAEGNKEKDAEENKEKG